MILRVFLNEYDISVLDFRIKMVFPAENLILGI